MQENEQQLATEDTYQMCAVCGSELQQYEWHYQECDRCLTQVEE
ncbi:MAG: hypothetical protein OWR52_01250 [Acidibacillus sp.]|uniref:YhfH family protein n=1 Tax=Sulfoacidibacillus ferrooxidans TaxID=2005001 RepID=A0A9X1VBI9_9BACL|nr:hypothetical protein [Sulfoacidibacillus ferrooxidans]MCI0183553.1 hypothetical protein [Sulfoacidibacillus ferrooxidans]MCY0892125.1 hypothetical protein [Acidibacillus sp.]